MLKEIYKQRLLHGIGIDLVEALVRVAPNSAITRAKKGRYGTGGGELERSIKYNVEPDGETILVTMKNYWIFVEFGTAPHIIRPKNGKALAWGRPQGKTEGGKTKREFVARVVHHPGTAPNPFIRSTLKTQFPRIVLDNVKKHLGGAV